MKKCPYCAEEIQEEAKKCRYCGEFLGKKPQTKWYYKTSTLVIAFLCVGPFMLPLVWFNPNLSRSTKIVASLIILFITYFIAIFVGNALKTISGYYQQMFNLF